MEKQYQTISSLKDPRVVFARSLTSVTNRQTANACLISGRTPLQWAIKNNWKIETIFCTKSSIQEIENDLCECEYCLTSEGIMKKISGTSYLIPILAVAHIPPKHFQFNKNTDFLLLLDGIQDHGNLGTIIRSACAFGIQDVILSDMRCDLFHRKTVESSRGTVFTIKATQVKNSINFLKQLKQSGYQIIVTTPYGSQLQSELQIKNKPVVLVIGNESDGVRKDVLKIADARIQIPMQPEVESLNVGVAAGISMYEIKIKAVLGMLNKKIKSTLGREINVAGRLIMHQLNQEFTKTTQFTATEAVLLMQLSCDSQMTLQEISHDTALFGDELEKLVQHLEEFHFIQATTNQKETWKITTTGESWLAQIWPLVERAEKKSLQSFSEDEIILLYDFVRRIQANY